VKIGVTLASFGYLVYIFFKTPDFYNDFISIWTDPEIYANADSLWLALLLVPFNWGIEAYKWKFLASKMEKISFIDAYKGVLAGLSLGFITPHAVGDYAARIYFMKVKHRLRAIGAVLLARISLFYITLVYGLMGFLILFRFTEVRTGFFNMEVLVPLCLLFFVIFISIFNYGLIAGYLIKINWFRKYIHPYVKVIGNYSTGDLYNTFLLSFIRYGIFTVQYLLVLQFFGVNVYNVLILSAIWLIFFTKSVFPSFNFLNDVGVREAAALFFFGIIEIEQPVIMAASLTVWCINIFIPSLVGLVIVLLTKEQNQNIKKVAP
jgi:uncharacterized membrane protein YbhN (UPF0104 family)